MSGRVLFWSKRVSLHRNFATEPVAGIFYTLATCYGCVAYPVFISHHRLCCLSFTRTRIRTGEARNNGSHSKQAASTVNLDASNVCHIAFIFERAPWRALCTYYAVTLPARSPSNEPVRQPSSEPASRLASRNFVRVCATHFSSDTDARRVCVASVGRIDATFVLLRCSFPLLSFVDLNEMTIICLAWITCAFAPPNTLDGELNEWRAFASNGRI